MTKRFRSPYRWIIMTKSSDINKNILKDFKDFHLLIDSEVLIAENMGDKFSLYLRKLILYIFFFLASTLCYPLPISCWILKALRVESSTQRRALPSPKRIKWKYGISDLLEWKSNPQPVAVTVTRLCPYATTGHDVKNIEFNYIFFPVNHCEKLRSQLENYIYIVNVQYLLLRKW